MSINKVSAAPQMLTFLIFEFFVTLIAIFKSASVTSSPLIEPNEPVKAVDNDDVPKNTNGKAHTNTTNISLGPVRKFLSDSIIVAIL